MERDTAVNLSSNEARAKPKQKAKAIALLSGGLDSLIAAKLVKDEGNEVVGLHLLSPFGCREAVERRTAAIGIPLLVREKGSAYLDVVQSPRFGYGRAMNPCIDCRIFMFEVAKTVMLQEGADFIVTGEVLGQRPMSQQKFAMALIDRMSPLDDLTLRPLSAKAFAPTLAERMGWVNRDHLLDIRGRKRTVQLEIGKKLGIEDFGSPGGGCLLTEVALAARIRDFFKNGHFANESQRLVQSELLRYGRHFRIHSRAKVIVSRNGEENAFIEQKWRESGGQLLAPEKFSGPLGILFGESAEGEIAVACSLLSRYGKPGAESNIIVSSVGVDANDGSVSTRSVPAPPPTSEHLIEEMRL